MTPSGTPAARQAAESRTTTSTTSGDTATAVDGSTATSGGATSGTTDAGSSTGTSNMDQSTGTNGAPDVTSGAPDASNGTQTTVTFDGTFNDVRNLADAIQNAPEDGAATDGSNTTQDTGDGSDVSSDVSIDTGTGTSSNSQIAQAGAASAQRNAGNANVSVRVRQAGNTGAVDQANNSIAVARSDVRSNWGSGSAGTTDSQASAWADAAQTGVSNTNVNVRVDSPGDIGNVTQSNGTYAGAQADGTAGAGGAGSSVASTTTDPGNTADPSSTGTPGTSGTPSTTGDSAAGTPDPNRMGDAHAKAAQNGATNVNVSVRVNSAGNNGTVDQSNTVAAAAGANVPAGTTGDGGAGAASGPFGTSQGVTTSGSAAASNDGDLIQEIEQMQASEGRPGEATRPGSDSSVPAAGFTDGTAAASQAGALNANVSVRVGSPGSDGAVHQGNNATATGTTSDQSQVTVTGGSSVNVAVAVPGASGAPQGAWTWNWDWDGAWTLPPVPGADSAPTAASIWDWMWKAGTSGAGSAGAATPPPSSTSTQSSDAPFGSWTWNWTWVFADGSTWHLDWSEACDCAWDWNWTWDWSKQTPVTGSATTDASAAGETAATDSPVAPRPSDPATDDGGVSQTNTVTAEATASVALATLSEASLDQTDAAAPAGTTGGESSASADQIVMNSQVARALSDSAQSDAWNVNVVWGVPVESVLQSNEVDAATTAEATARISQGIVQAQDGGSKTDQEAAATQIAINQQIATSAAQSAQQTAHNVNTVAAPKPKAAAVGAVQQSNTAKATVGTTIDTDIAQWIGQFQTGGAQTESQGAEATQIHLNSQVGVASAQVAQAGLVNRNDVDVPWGSQATNPSVAQSNEASVETTATDRSSIDGWIHQGQGGLATVEDSSADQQGIVGQQNSAYAPAQQSNIRNNAAWSGVEPPAAPGDGGSNPGDGGTNPGDGGPNPGAGGNPGTGINPVGGSPAPSATQTGAGGGRQPGATSATPGISSSTSVIGGHTNATGTSTPAGSHRDVFVVTTQVDHHGGQAPGTLTPPEGPSWSAHNPSEQQQNDGGNAPGQNPGSLPPVAPPAPTPPSPSAAGSTPNPTKVESAPPRTKQRGHYGPPPPGHEDWSADGATSPAPASSGGGGGGLAVTMIGRYELAVPEAIGRQLSILILGRSGAFVEPFEWPG